MGATVYGYIRQHHVGLVAIFIALSGTAWAAATIGPKDIKKNAIRSKHVKEDNLKGTDIAEATLGQVPSAQSAVNAQTANSANSAQTATSADSAQSADLLDNLNSSDFLRSNAQAGGDLGGSFSSLQIGGNAVGSPEVGPNALGGGDIDESTLSGLDAQKVDGGNVCRLNLSVSADPAFSAEDPTPTTLCTEGQFTLQGHCTLVDDAPTNDIAHGHLRILTSSNDAFFDASGDVSPPLDDWDTDSFVLVAGTDDEAATGTGDASAANSFYVASANSGTQLVGVASVRATETVEGTEGNCQFVGAVIG